jgi:hypothetical protein
MENLKIEKLLQELVDEIKILTARQKSEAFKKFNEEFLTTKQRQKMYEAFDGERTLQQISNDIGCKLNSLQVFSQLLIDKDLVDFETKGKSRIINKSLARITAYYSNKETKGV